MQPNKPHKDLPKDAGEHTIARLDMMRNSKGNLHTAEIRRNMQRIMQVGQPKSGQNKLTSSCSTFSVQSASLFEQLVPGTLQW